MSYSQNMRKNQRMREEEDEEKEILLTLMNPLEEDLSALNSVFQLFWNCGLFRKVFLKLQDLKKNKLNLAFLVNFHFQVIHIRI